MYRVDVPARLRRYVRRQAPRLQREITDRLELLASDPYAPDISKALHGPLAGSRSSDLGGLRIIYEVDDTIRVLDVIDIGPRGDIYKR